MNASRLIEALKLPAGALVDRRVPKSLLVENGVPTASDRRQIKEGIEALRWVAALKPTTIGVPKYRDATREYLEIAVLYLVLRPEAKAERLNELVHRAVPYPVWLVTDQVPQLTVSLAHKRRSHGEVDKIVLEEGYPLIAQMNTDEEKTVENAFLEALAIERQPRTTLHAVYQGWVDTVLALQAARLTGAFASSRSSEQVAARRDALRLCAELESQMTALRNAAKKEKQLARQVALNLKLKHLQADYAAAFRKL